VDITGGMPGSVDDYSRPISTIRQINLPNVNRMVSAVARPLMWRQVLD